MMSSLSIFALALGQALILLALAPLASGITRVLRARMHSRQGPGLLQEYRDIAKLLRRQNIAPQCSGALFQMMPYVMVGTMLTIASALPLVTRSTPLPGLGDVITLVYLFAVARFFFILAGLDTGSPFSAIGASRESLLGILVEPILMLGLWVTALLAGSSNLGLMGAMCMTGISTPRWRSAWRCWPAPSPPSLKWASCRSIWPRPNRSCRRGR